MANNGMKVSDKLRIKTESVLNGDEIVILPSGTTGTKTTIQSSQTSDIILNLPSTSGTIVNDGDVAALVAGSSAITTLQSNVSTLQSNDTTTNTSITTLNAVTNGNTNYISAQATIVIDPSISTTTRTHTFWAMSVTSVNIRYLATGHELFLINETNGDIAVTYDYSTPSSNQALTTLRQYECLRITGKSTNYQVELERTFKYRGSTAVVTSGGTSTLTWLDSGSQYYNVSGTGGTILLPSLTQYVGTAQEYDTYLGKEVIIRNLASGNLIVRDSGNISTYRTIKPNESYTSFKAGLNGWMITGLQGAESASNTATYRNGYIPSGLAGSNINLPAAVIAQSTNLYLLKNAANSANSNYGGYVQLNASAITDNTSVSLNLPNTSGKMLVSGECSTNGSPSSFTLTSGSVTYNSGATQTVYDSKYISGSKIEVTAHVTIKLSAISSPVNTALSIPTYINPTTALAGIKPSVAVRCNNVTVTGQVFAHVEYGTNAFILTAVNNGTETAISAASFLQANSELNFSITYVADY